MDREDHIIDNDLPGQPFDYGLRVNSRHAHPKYKTVRSTVPQPKSAINGWAVFAILLIGAVCFGCGVSIGHGSREEAPSAVTQPSSAAPQPTITVTQTIPVASFPPSCIMAYETISKMYPDLEVTIDAAQKQIVIGNKAYVAIVAKDSAAISKAMADQYDLKRETSHSSQQLQNELVELTSNLNQCKTDLDR